MAEWPVSLEVVSEVHSDQLPVHQAPWQHTHIHQHTKWHTELHSTGNHTRLIVWLGSVLVGRWTRDREVAGSTPAAALFGQQPWASCSHPMCPCSPKSITWYLAKAFLLKSAVLWQRQRVQWTRGHCRAVLKWFCRIAKNRDTNHLLYIFYSLPWHVFFFVFYFTGKHH